MAKKSQKIQDVITESLEWEIVSEGQDPSIIPGVLLCGPESKNGRKYRPESFGGVDKVAEAYEGKPVYYNHENDQQRARNRDVQQIAGVVKSARWVEGKGVVGSIHVLDENERLMKLYRLRAKGIGMSHTVMAEVDSKSKVARVQEVISVDVVVNPATTQTFVEQEISMEDSLATELSTVRSEREGFKAERDKLQAQLTEAQQKLEKVIGELTTKTEECKLVSDKLAVFEQEKVQIEHKAQVAKEIEAAGLKDKISATVVGILESLPQEKRADLIAEQSRLIKVTAPGALPRQPQVHVEKQDSSTWDVKTFNAQFVK